MVGTGSAGVQVIQELSKLVGQLYVFQRNGNWCAPLGNSKIDSTKMKKNRKNYPAIFEHCNKTFGSCRIQYFRSGFSIGSIFLMEDGSASSGLCEGLGVEFGSL